MFYTIFFIFLKETWRCSGARTVTRQHVWRFCTWLQYWEILATFFWRLAQKLAFFSFRRSLRSRGENISDSHISESVNSLRSELVPHVCVSRCRCLVSVPRFDSSSAAFPWGLWLFSWVWVAFLQVHRVDGGAKLAPGVSWWPLQCVFLPLGYIRWVTFAAVAKPSSHL